MTINGTKITQTHHPRDPVDTLYMTGTSNGVVQTNELIHINVLKIIALTYGTEFVDVRGAVGCEL